METKELLKKIRTERKLTKKDVANLSGIPYPTYLKYEYGERELGLTSLQKLADFYGVTTDYLLGRETAQVPTQDLASVVKNSNVQTLEEILILRRAIQEEADRQGITLSKWETVKESAMDGNGTQIKTYPVTEGEKADAAPLIDDDL